MASSSTSRRRGTPPAAHPEAIEQAMRPAAAPRLPPPAGFARKLTPNLDAAAAAVERAARCPVAAPPPSLPPPAAFSRRPHPAPRAASQNPSPPEPQARPPMPPPPSSSRRRRRNRGRNKARDWEALPREALGVVLGKLDHIEILMGAGQACGSSRRAAREDPSLWRRVDMRGHADLFDQVNLHGMAQAAVRAPTASARPSGASTPATTPSSYSSPSSMNSLFLRFSHF
ncbi:unnamed protein product [Urochloa humidicola]